MLREGDRCRVTGDWADLVVWLDVQLDLFAGEGADSVGSVSGICRGRRVVRERYLICMVSRDPERQACTLDL